jgi:hypothetical protein
VHGRSLIRAALAALVVSVALAPSLASAQLSTSTVEERLKRIEMRATMLSRQLLFRLDQARAERLPIETHCFDAKLTEVHALLRVIQRDKDLLAAGARSGEDREARRVGVILRVLRRRVVELTREARRCDDPRGLRGLSDFEIEVTVDADTPRMDPTVVPRPPPPRRPLHH